MPNYMYNHMYFSDNNNGSEVNQWKCVVGLQIWRSERANALMEQLQPIASKKI